MNMKSYSTDKMNLPRTFPLETECGDEVTDAADKRPDGGGMVPIGGGITPVEAGIPPNVGGIDCGEVKAEEKSAKSSLTVVVAPADGRSKLVEALNGGGQASEKSPNSVLTLGG